MSESNPKGAKPTTERSAKGRRVTIDLTAAAAKEVDRLRHVSGLTTADMFRHALSLFRIYVEAKESGKTLELVDQNEVVPNTRIELPVTILQTSKR